MTVAQYYVIRSDSTNNELYHHGIKGMKWGVRRFQKKDGSLTPAGAKRYQTVGDDALNTKKQEYKRAKREYGRAFDDAYNKAAFAYSPIKRLRTENDERWKDVANKSETLKTKKAEYQQAKKEYKDTNKEALAARRNRAIKIGAAAAGTALAAYGAYKVSKIAKDKAYQKLLHQGRDSIARLASREHDHFVRTDKGLLDARDHWVQDTLVKNTHTRAERGSKNTIAALKTLAGKNREFSIAELAEQGLKVVWAPDLF